MEMFVISVKFCPIGGFAAKTPSVNDIVPDKVA